MAQHYPPHHTPGHGYPQPAKPPMSTGRKIALFGCLPVTVLAILTFGGCAVLGGAVINEADKAVKADASEDARAAKEDVKITSCKIVEDEFLGMDLKAKVVITNHGKKRASYIVRGELLDSEQNKVGDELLATVENLAPGKSSTQDFTGLFTSDDFKGVKDASCSVVGVSRDEWLADN